MPRHIHKPIKDKSTKNILQTIHDAQQATKDIKAELLEHNSKIHLHGTSAGAQSNSTGKSNEQKTASVARSQPGQTPASDRLESSQPKSAWPTVAKSSDNIAQNSSSQPEKSSSDSYSNTPFQDKKGSKDTQPQASVTKSRPSDSEKETNSGNASFGGNVPGATFSPYTQAVEILQQSTQHWIELQTQFAAMWLSGFSKFMPSKEK